MRTTVGWAVPRVCGRDTSHLRRIGSNLHSALSDPDGTHNQALEVFKGRVVTRHALAALFSADDLRLLECCRILEPAGDGYESSFALHLIDGFAVFTDPNVADDVQLPEYLDPLWEASSLVRLLIRSRCESGLDVGCGCGILSLAMSRFTNDVIGIDINHRAIAVSRLNAAMNGVRNVTFRLGDLFDGVSGQRFDRVIFNSPTDEEGTTYISPLRAGESILHRFFGEVTRHLSPSGYCQVNLAMNDSPDSRFMERLREWLGPDGHSLQLLLLEKQRYSPSPGHTRRRGWLTLRRAERHSLVSRCFPYHIALENMPSAVGHELIDFLLSGSATETSKPLSPAARTLLSGMQATTEHDNTTS